MSHVRINEYQKTQAQKRMQNERYLSISIASILDSTNVVQN